VYEPLAPILIERSEGATHLADSLFALAFRFSRNQIRKALHLGQVHPAPVKGSACELSRFGRAAVWKFAQYAKHRSDNGPSSMALKLDNIFTSETCRPLKEKDQSLINRSLGEAGSRSLESMVFRGAGVLPQSASVTVLTSGPETRITATPEGTAPLDNA
jgi:hypothetical protein